MHTVLLSVLPVLLFCQVALHTYFECVIESFNHTFKIGCDLKGKATW